MKDTTRRKKIAARVQDNLLLSGHTYRIEVSPEEPVEGIRPGRFFMVQVGEGLEPFLLRPFSVGDLIEDDRQRIVFYYHARGRGTRLLSTRKPGEAVQLLGPLGNGFALKASARRHLMVAGGIGAAPFGYLARALTAEDPYARLTWMVGARTASDLLLVDAMKQRGAEVVLSTDDGSAGSESTVIEPLVGWLDAHAGENTAIYVCGPDPMMKAVAVVLKQRGLDAQFSLEAHMACGVGVCNGCAVEVNLPDGTPGYKKVCVDGPVMTLKELLG